MKFTEATYTNKVEGGNVFACLSVCNQDNLKSYKRILMKLAVNDHHHNIPLEFELEDTVESAYPCQCPDQNSV